MIIKFVLGKGEVKSCLVLMRFEVLNNFCTQLEGFFFQLNKLSHFKVKIVINNFKVLKSVNLRKELDFYKFLCIIFSAIESKAQV